MHLERCVPQYLNRNCTCSGSQRSCDSGNSSHHTMAGQCQVCCKQEARYKCPKCLIAYCTLACFKSPEHSHAPESSSLRENKSEEKDKPDKPDKPENNPGDKSEQSSEHMDLLSKIAADPVVQSLLKYKSLKAHLSVLLKLLLDSSVTKEPIYENRKEIANMRLCDLRIGGAEENELVEEFVQRVLQLQSEYSG